MVACPFRWGTQRKRKTGFYVIAEQIRENIGTVGRNLRSSKVLWGTGATRSKPGPNHGSACIRVCVLASTRTKIYHAGQKCIIRRTKVGGECLVVNATRDFGFDSQSPIVVTQYPFMRRITVGFIFGHLYTLQLFRKDKRAEHQEQLTLDRAFRGRIMAEPLPGANFRANRGRRRAP
jgi:hypothetical protein